MAVTAIDKKETTPFSVKGDTGTDKTVFHLRCMTAREHYKLAAAGKKINEEDLLGLSDIFVSLIKAGVVRITNFIIDGKPQDIDAVDDDVVDMLPLPVVEELVDAITKKNTISENQAKN